MTTTDDNIAWKVSITKGRFEYKLCEEFGQKNLVSARHSENVRHDDGLKVVNMTLYYIGKDHIGTWQTGKGWTFKSADKHRRES